MNNRTKTYWPSVGVGRAFLGLLIAAMFALSGCGEKTGTIPISGNVTYQDKPLSGARVVFTPKSGGRPADGLTDSNGTYRLGTFMAGDGALAGEYTVTISKSDVDVSQPPSTEITDGAAYEPVSAEAAKSQIPARYASPTSGLKAIIEAGGPKVFDFKLTE